MTAHLSYVRVRTDFHSLPGAVFVVHQSFPAAVPRFLLYWLMYRRQRPLWDRKPLPHGLLECYPPDLLENILHPGHPKYGVPLHDRCFNFFLIFICIQVFICSILMFDFFYVLVCLECGFSQHNLLRAILDT